MKRKPTVVVIDPWCPLERAAAKWQIPSNYKLILLSCHVHEAVQHVFGLEHADVVLISGREVNQPRDHFEEARHAAEWISEHTNSVVGVADPKRSNVSIYAKGAPLIDVVIHEMTIEIDPVFVEKLMIRERRRECAAAHHLYEHHITKKQKVLNWEAILISVMSFIATGKH